MSKKLQICMMVLATGVLLGVAGPVLADTPTNQLVKMVTYFPVPYASYGNLYISKGLNVGCDGRSFAAEIGSTDCNAHNNPTIIADSVKFTAQNVTFEANMDLYTHRARFGQWFNGENDLYRNAEIKINNNLRLNLTGITSDDVIESLEASTLNSKAAGMGISQSSMLPACDGRNEDGSFAGHQVQWHPLKFGSSKTFLTCGPVIGCYGTRELQNKCTNYAGDTSHNTREYGPGYWDESGGCVCRCNQTDSDGNYYGIPDEDRCKHSCWSDVRSGRVENCGYRGGSVIFGSEFQYEAGTWRYSPSCGCNCPGHYKLDSVGRCERKCISDILAGNPETCESYSPGSIVLGVDQYQSGQWWEDSCSCLCNKDPRYKLNSGSGRCEHTKWSDIVACNAKGEGYTWDNSNQKCVEPPSSSESGS